MQSAHSSAPAARRAPVAPGRCAGGRARAGPRRVAAAALPEFLRSLFDYSSWAPKSSRIWRLNQYQPPEADSYNRGDKTEGEVTASDMRVLQDRLEQLRSSGSGSDAGGGAAASTPPGAQQDSAGAGARSFSDADDDELTWALNRRISEIAVSSGDWGATVDEEAARKPLTGQEVQQLLMTKYGKLYDLSFAKRSIPGKTFVSLNIMWLHLGQRSFKLSPEQYNEKVDSVAQLVNILGQTDKVRAFLSAPAKSEKGLPKRPVVGTAVSIQLNLDEAQVAEWFGAGYD